MYTCVVSRLDRESVLDAGIEIADEEGLDAVTLRRIAERLSVTPMALYRHVASKDDLLDGMADLLYAELELPAPGGDWWEGLAAIARSLRLSYAAGGIAPHSNAASTCCAPGSSRAVSNNEPMAGRILWDVDTQV